MLSGGGAKGLAHIGVLKVLEHEGVPVDLLVGTSMGGLIAAGYAAGLTPEQIEQEALRMSRLRSLISLIDRSVPRTGLFEGKRVQGYLIQQLGDVTFADLRLPLAVVAVDLVRGEEVVLQEGSVVEAIRATISIPGIFAPLQLGERVLVDGGVLNNLPVDVARNMGADVTIAVNVQTEFNGLRELRDAQQRVPFSHWTLIIETLRACLVLMRDRLTEYKIREADPDVLIRPTLPEGATMLGGFNHAAEIIAAGEEATMAILPQIKQLIGFADDHVATRREGDSLMEYVRC
ncbi:MAG: patatin-like phospholipase family protein [Anaerolineae bacterium]|nr:patatin-like phospholipase family protein [Anaerolineae bacterium]